MHVTMVNLFHSAGKPILQHVYTCLSDYLLKLQHQHLDMREHRHMHACTHTHTHAHTLVPHTCTVYASFSMTAFSQLDQQENYLSGFYAVMSYCHLFREKIKAGKIQSQSF